jgi:hypothetical protein
MHANMYAENAAWRYAMVFECMQTCRQLHSYIFDERMLHATCSFAGGSEVLGIFSIYSFAKGRGTWDEVVYGWVVGMGGFIVAT